MASQRFFLAVLIIPLLASHVPAADATPSKAAPTVRVLTVGNSFTRNATRYLPDLAKAGKHELIHRSLVVGGSSLQLHAEKMQRYEQDPSDKAGRYANGRSLPQELAAEPWDFVTIQQVSIQSHNIATYNPYAGQLADCIRSHAPGAKLMMHQTWAYRRDDPRFAVKSPAPGEPATQKAMYEGLCNAYRTIAAELGAGVIPVGDAFYLADSDPKWGYTPDKQFDFQNARPPELPDQTHSLHAGWRWSSQGDRASLRMDGHHANTAGEYLGACVFYEVLFGDRVVGNSFVPPALDAAYAKFLQNTAHQAVLASQRRAMLGDNGPLTASAPVAGSAHGAVPDEVPFAAPRDISGGGVSGITSLVAGDIDGDGRADVVAIEGGKHANGRRAFAWFEAPPSREDTWRRHDFQVDVALRPFLGAACLADMDGDGDLDLIVSSDMHSGGTMAADVFVFRNPRPATSADDTWQAYRLNETTLRLHHINDMAIADLDGDGKQDVVCRSLEPNQLHIFFQNTLSSFTHKWIDTQLRQSEGLAVGHLDDDALPDITFSGAWLRSPGKPRIEPYERATIDARYATVNQNTKEAIGDIDRDGRNDVVIGPAEAYRDGKDHYLAWYRNTGDFDGDWQRRIIEPSTNNNHTVKLGDIDGDNDLDVVTGVPWPRNGISKSIHIYFNDGSGGFGDRQTVIEGKGLYTGVLVDVDRDGALDIVGQDTYSNQSKPWLYWNLRRD